MKFITVFFLTAMVFVQGCGYTTKSTLKPEWRYIYIAPVGNDIDFTDQYERPLYTPTLEVKLRNAISKNFLRDGYLKIANNMDDADIVLKTTLTSFEHQPLLYDTVDLSVREWRVVITVKMELLEQSTKEVIWKSEGSGSEDQFRLGSQTSSEDTAIEAAVEDLAKRIVEGTVEHW